MFKGFLFLLNKSRNEDSMRNNELFMLLENKEWDKLLNLAKTKPGDCYRILEITDMNGNNIFHIIAKGHPHPYKFAGQFFNNINYTVTIPKEKTNEWLNKPNLQQETFNTLCKQKDINLYNELAPNFQTQLKFFS